MTTALMSIVVGTTNVGKLKEIRSILEDLPLEVLSAADVLGDAPNVVEDGDTFEANAQKKACAIARLTAMVTLADDSGLEVDALGGRPGVRSARFKKEGATDAENNQALLDLMVDIDDAERQARFRCVIALVDPWSGDDDPQLAEGRCEGRIARTPSGAGGFGYDPLFFVGDEGRTMAELGPDQKNRISHRARALQALRPRLEALVQARLGQAGQLAEAQPKDEAARDGAAESEPSRRQ